MIQCYNLDAIIAVGYRVNSKKATRFRQWATKTLKEYITKGFVLNDELLKNGKPFGHNYFDEILMLTAENNSLKMCPGCGKAFIGNLLTLSIYDIILMVQISCIDIYLRK